MAQHHASTFFFEGGEEDSYVLNVLRLHVGACERGAFSARQTDMSILLYSCIVQNGFFVSSGEKKDFRLHGAAYGDGVYVSKDLSYSMRYARPFGRGGLNTIARHWKIVCVALCEVVSSPEVKDCPGTNNCVVPNAELIVPRFLFVWQPGYSGSSMKSFDRLQAWCRSRLE